MFDKLIESTKQKTGRRTGRFFAITSIVYALALVGIGVGTIVTFSPVLAEEYSLMLPLIPLPLSREPEVAQPQRQNHKAQPDPGFVVPKKPVIIPPATEVTSLRLRTSNPNIGIGGGPFPNSGEHDLDRGGDPPPPPAIKPPPTPNPTPSPTPEKKPINKVSEGVLQGIAIHREKPAYPQMARAIRSSGQVQVQVTISEEGRVIEATILNGPPLLRGAALEAARKWVFSPTKLSNVPVKVQGVLTFNFTFE